MNESSYKGVSIRAILALLTVGSGLLFLYLIALLALWLLPIEQGLQIAVTIIVAIVGFVNLSLGYYLGQKNTQEAPPQE